MTDDLDDDSASCPRCSGYGFVDCNCGGDLCVCDNYGERDCPLCHSEGNVSVERYERYEAAQRKWWDEYQAAITKRRVQPQNPLTTTKRAKVKAARKQRKAKA